MENIKVLTILLSVLLLARNTLLLSTAPPLPPTCPTNLPFTDRDILEFALNLECLEAEFYSWSAFGHGLSPELLGNGPGSIGGEKARLSPIAQAYAEEIAYNEMDHVKFLRSALGKNAIACPKLDIGPAFQTVANAAIGRTLQPPFNVYGNDISFYLGAFIFEDVGATAYNGAAPYIKSKEYLESAASILAVEAYHGGVLRLLLTQEQNLETPYGVSIGQVGNAISALRSKLGMDGEKDEPIIDSRTGRPILFPVDKNSLIFSRQPDEVIRITKPFFPEGLNGYFK